MFLSKVEVKDRREMVDFYALHSMVYSLFPDSAKGIDRSNPDAAAILYRFEKGRSPYVLIQSRIAPFWGDTKRFTPSFEAGARFWFRLRGNTTWKRSRQPGRLGILNPDDQMAWLQRKANDNGFGLVRASITECPGLVKARRHDKDVALTPVTFEGELTVAAPDLFLRALELGIGSGKGFGCGLLSLAPC